jgi:hypothetical protein
VSTKLGREQANYIRLHSGRHFSTNQPGPDMLITFVFPAGQMCFSEHKVPLDREPFFRKLAGDWRKYDSGQVLRARDWLDDFGEHQQRLADQRQKAGVE